MLEDQLNVRLTEMSPQFRGSWKFRISYLKSCVYVFSHFSWDMVLNIHHVSYSWAARIRSHCESQHVFLQVSSSSFSLYNNAIVIARQHNFAPRCEIFFVLWWWESDQRVRVTRWPASLFCKERRGLPSPHLSHSQRTLIARAPHIVSHIMSSCATMPLMTMQSVRSSRWLASIDRAYPLAFHVFAFRCYLVWHSFCRLFEFNHSGLTDYFPIFLIATLFFEWNLVQLLDYMILCCQSVKNREKWLVHYVLFSLWIGLMHIIAFYFRNRWMTFSPWIRLIWPSC